ncbi:hypothetical protein C0J52_19522 [Blattella germanica]|nr:hypothetical protein C0J52_19522 [Blattella germanica]
MVRTYKKVTGGRPYQHYSQDSLNKAVRYVSSGRFTIRQAAEKYQVPNSTISDKLKYKHTGHHGGQKCLTPDENYLSEGFRAAGIVPCDRQQVLKRLPNIIPPETDELRRSWTDTFVDMLCDARASPAARTQNRGKRFNITPGKSVGVQDLAPQNSGNESPSDSSSSEEEPDCSDSNDSECIVCGKLWSQSKRGDDWVQCMICKGWAHEKFSCNEDRKIRTAAILPPLEQPEADTDQDSDESDNEVQNNPVHLPRRILQSAVEIFSESDNEDDALLVLDRTVNTQMVERQWKSLKNSVKREGREGNEDDLYLFQFLYLQRQRHLGYRTPCKIFPNFLQDIQSAFRTTGLYPFNPKEILKKHPSNIVDSGRILDASLLEFVANKST